MKINSCNNNIREELLIEKMLKKNDVKYNIFLPITEAAPENKYHWILTGIPINNIKLYNFIFIYTV